MTTPSKPRALYYRVLRYQPENLARLHQLFEMRELDDPRQDTDALLSEMEVLCAPLGFLVDDAKLARCPKLKAICSNTTGVAHIDVAAAEARGITVCALHDEQAFLDHITPTSEHTIGLMMAALRRIPAAHAAAAADRWDRRPWGAPAMLSRLRLSGIVGFGRLGRKVARIAAAMEMAVDHYDPYVPGGAVSLIDLAGRSDVLSIHGVANEETRGLVSRAVLEALPDGAVVVNTARGELLDVEALLDLLELGRIWAAGLDVVDGEFQP